MTRILVVDDDKVAVNALCKLLEMDGFEAVGLSSSEEALSRVQTERFGAVVTDLEMPRMHGLDFLRAARAAHAELPILVVTAYIGSPACDSALALGAKRVFGKPLKYDLLANELNRIGC